MQADLRLTQKLTPGIRNNIGGWWEGDGPLDSDLLAAAFSRTAPSTCWSTSA